MRKLGDLVWVDGRGDRVGPRPGRRTSASSRRSGAASSGRSRVLEDETGTVEATWFGRRFIERRLRAGDEVIVSGKLKHRGSASTLDNPEFQREDDGRAAPRRADRAGLPADRGPDGGPPAAGDPRGARPGGLRLPGVPAGRRSARPRSSPPIAEALEEAHYPTSFEGRDAALRRLAFDELLALQLGMVARRRARGRAHATPIPAADPADGRDPRRARGERSARKLGRDGAAHRRPGDRDRRDPGRPRPAGADAPPRSRATSARARPRSRPTRSPRRRSPGARARCSPRPTCSPASTPRRSAALARGPRRCRSTLLTGSLTGGGPAQGARGDRVGAGGGRRRDARADPGGGLVRGPRRSSSSTSSTGSASSSAARSRRRRGGVAPRPADDRDADPADARPGPLRRPRRVRPADAAGGPGPDPDRDPPPGRARRARGTRSATRRRPGAGRSSSCR